MREIPLGRLQYLYHCRVCNRVNVHRLHFSTAVRTASSNLILRSWIQNLRNGPRVDRGFSSLAKHLERLGLKFDLIKIFERGAVFGNGLRHLASQHLLRSPKAVGMSLAGGVLLGTGLVFINKPPQTTTSAGCQSETENDCETQTQNFESTELSLAQTPISELSFLQQLKLFVRFIYLSILFSPAAVLYGVSYLTGSRDIASLAWRYVFFAIQMAGPAFIKLGQWASTRRDIFSEDFCRSLSKLHTRCNPHSWGATERMMRENFGENWKEEVIIIDHKAIGSGCVAQVYQGYLKTQNELAEREFDSTEVQQDVKKRDNSYIPIAVKVLHPGVVGAMDADIRLMRYVASWVDYLYPDVHWIALKECVDEFSFVMQQQVSSWLVDHEEVYN